MPIEDLVHVGVSLISDQRGQAIKCVWTVYVGSVDLAQGALDLGNGGMSTGQAADAALREGVAWLEVQAATREPSPPSVPVPDAPREASPAPKSVQRAPTGSRGSRPGRAQGRRLASAAVDVPGVIDPAVGDLQDDSVSGREDSPTNAVRQARKPRRRSGQVRPE